MGALWGALRRSWALLGTLGHFLSALGALLGHSWALLGRLGALSGRSWDALGRSWGAPQGYWVPSVCSGGVFGTFLVVPGQVLGLIFVDFR